MEIKPIWYDYAIFDDECEITGIREDAPPEAKKAYDEYVKYIQECEKEGIPVTR